MDFLFGSRKTPQEILKQNQRALTRSQRDLDRERVKLEQQEKKLIIDIKKSAKLNQIGAVKIMARDLVRTRRYVQKMHETRAQLQQISLQIQTFSSNQQMADSIKGVTMAMKSMNRGHQVDRNQSSADTADYGEFRKGESSHGNETGDYG